MSRVNLVFMMIAVSFLPTCNENECEAARQRVRDCFPGPCEEGGLCSNEPIDCSGHRQCVSDCINDADCVEIRDGFSGEATGKSKLLLTCIEKCGMSR